MGCNSLRSITHCWIPLLRFIMFHNCRVLPQYLSRLGRFLFLVLTGSILYRNSPFIKSFISFFIAGGWLKVFMIKTPHSRRNLIREPGGGIIHPPSCSWHRSISGHNHVIKFHAFLAWLFCWGRAIEFWLNINTWWWTQCRRCTSAMCCKKFTPTLGPAMST